MSAIPFVTLDDPRYGEAVQVAPLVRRVIANNPSKFTYHGTGTYIVGARRRRRHRSRARARRASRRAARRRSTASGAGDPRHALPRRPLAARRVAEGRDRRADVAFGPHGDDVRRADPDDDDRRRTAEAERRDGRRSRPTPTSSPTCASPTARSRRRATGGRCAPCTRRATRRTTCASRSTRSRRCSPATT